MLPAGVRVYVACGVTDMRKGFDGLAALVQTALALDPYSGALFLFRGRRGDLLKALLWDGQGLVLYAKRLERGRFVGRFCVYAVDPRIWSGVGPPAAFYRYSPDRDGERPRGHLAGFSGFLHADAYAGYDALYRSSGQQPPRVTQVACFAHARRKFFDVWEATKSPIAEEAVRRIAKLYEIEGEITGKSAVIRLTTRRARSQPLLDGFKTCRHGTPPCLWQDGPGQGIQLCAHPLGRADLLCHRWTTEHRQQFERAAAERGGHHTEKFHVRRQRPWRRPGSNVLHAD
jgi:hypothetical protein